MKRLKHLTIFIMLFASITIFVSAKEQYKIPVVLYHHLLHDSENHNFINDATITPETFEKHMSYLYNEGYETITTDELYQYLTNKKEITGKKILITFDDGYLSNYIYAYDILKKYNYTATIFLVTSMTSAKSRDFDADGLVMLSLEDMEKSKDIFEFGSHTENMHRKNDIDIPYITCMPKDYVVADITLSYTVPGIKKIFAYPYGQYNSDTINILKSLKTEMAFTVGGGYVTKSSNIYSLPRFTIRRSTSFEDFKKIFEKLK